MFGDVAVRYCRPISPSGHVGAVATARTPAWTVCERPRDPVPSLCTRSRDLVPSLCTGSRDVLAPPPRPSHSSPSPKGIVSACDTDRPPLFLLTLAHGNCNRCGAAREDVLRGARGRCESLCRVLCCAGGRVGRARASRPTESRSGGGADGGGEGCGSSSGQPASSQAAPAQCSSVVTAAVPKLQRHASVGWHRAVFASVLARFLAVPLVRLAPYHHRPRGARAGALGCSRAPARGERGLSAAAGRLTRAAGALRHSRAPGHRGRAAPAVHPNPSR